MKKTLILIFLVSILNAQVNQLVYNGDYQIITTDRFEIVYDKEYKEEAFYSILKVDNLLKTYDKLFGYRLDYLTITLSSRKMEEANGFSTQNPTNETVLYSNGASMVDYFSSTYWLDTLLIHEIAHNYQINAKMNPISSTIKKVFGNNNMPIWFNLPLFTMPNQLLPMFYTEGNSVLSESRFSNGGRLYSGRAKALLNVLIHDNMITPNRLINRHNIFPFTEEKYIVGGYFFAYLQEYYHNSYEIFKIHSMHFINPFILNQDFQYIFRKSLGDMIKEFVRYYKKQIFNKSSQDTILSHSLKYGNINKIDNKLYWMTASKYKINTLNIYDIGNSKLIQEETSLLFGKVFKIDDTLYSNSSFSSDTYQISMGLYDDNGILLDNTKSKYITDIGDSQSAYIDVGKSFLDKKLYINNKYINTVNSPAIFDNQNNIYYFKQNSKIKYKRELYKNDILLTSFNGYYSNIADIDDDKIYFLANSKNGSSVYIYHNNHFSKVLPQDDIIDFKLISKNKAMICFISSDGYNYKIIDLKDKISTTGPYYEKYSFDNLDFSSSNIQIPISKRYNELANLKYSSLYPSFTFDEYFGSTLSVNLSLQDPLFFNSLQILLTKRQKYDYDDFYASYQNNRYYANFGINYRKIKRSQIISPFIKLPIYQKGRYSSDIGILYKKDTVRNDAIISFIDMQFAKNSFYSHDYHKMFDMKLYNKQFTKSNAVTNSVNIHATKQFFETNFIKLGYKRSISNTMIKDYKQSVFVGKILYSNSDKTDFIIKGLKRNFFTKDLQRISIGLKKNIELSHYFYTFPFGIKDNDIYVEYEDYYVNGYRKDTSFYQQKAGINLTLLLWHNIDMDIQVEYIYNSLDKNNFSIITFGTRF